MPRAVLWQLGAAAHGFPHRRDIPPWHSNACCPLARRASPRHRGAVSKKHLRFLLKRRFSREDVDKKPSSSQHSFTHGNLLCHAAGIRHSGTARNASRAPVSEHTGRARSCAPSNAARLKSALPTQIRRQLPAPKPIPARTAALSILGHAGQLQITPHLICCGAARRRRKTRRWECRGWETREPAAQRGRQGSTGPA